MTTLARALAGESDLPAPRTVEETGIRRTLLEELAMRCVYLEGELSLRELGERLGLALPVVEELFQRLRRAQLLEVTGMSGATHRVAVTTPGRERAQELLARTLYAGRAPVPLETYAARVRAQHVGGDRITQADVRRAFAPLVLDDETLHRLGVAIISGTSMVLHGPTGTGKTAVAEHIPDVYEDGVWIPHAVEVDGQVITVFDPGVHRPIARGGAAPSAFAREDDARWVYCERPRVLAGGELTIEMLDLQFNASTGFYTAPLQVKANNGVLVLDDFGRQRIRPEELLNRWIVPLDRRIDFLTLQGGKKFEVPFELFVVFSTNLDPATGFRADRGVGITDEAFLRRIPNKIAVGYASPEQFLEILRRVCAGERVAFDGTVGARLLSYLTNHLRQPLRPCYPRDLVRQVCWDARYEGRAPVLDWPAVERACTTYFLAREG
jgi:hypothetical protein